jgi:hypothetical protein
MLSRVRFGAALFVVCALGACGSEIERGAGSARSPKEDVPSKSGAGPAGTAERAGAGKCENFALDFGPVTLPSGSKGASYEVRLKDHAEPGWSGVVYFESSGRDLPAGLELTGSSDPVLQGVPTSAGSFEITVLAGHGKDSNGCSTMPDPHVFRLDIADPDGGIEAGPDAD